MLIETYKIQILVSGVYYSLLVGWFYGMSTLVDLKKYEHIEHNSLSPRHKITLDGMTCH